MLSDIILCRARLPGCPALVEGPTLHRAHLLLFLFFFAIYGLTVELAETVEEARRRKRKGGDRPSQAERHIESFTSKTTKASVSLGGSSEGPNQNAEAAGTKARREGRDQLDYAERHIESFTSKTTKASVSLGGSSEGPNQNAEAAGTKARREGRDQLDYAERHIESFTSKTTKASVSLRRHSVGHRLRVSDSDYLLKELRKGSSGRLRGAINTYIDMIQKSLFIFPFGGVSVVPSS